MLKHKTLNKILLLSIGLTWSMLIQAKNASPKDQTKNGQETSSETSKNNQTPQSVNPGNFSTLNITGNEKIGGNLTVVEDTHVGDNVIASQMILESQLKVGDALTVNGCVNIDDNLRINHTLNASCINADNISTCRESTEKLVACTNKADFLTVVNNTRVGGIAYVDEIDPLKNQTTCINSDVAILDTKKLLVNEINPVKCLCCPCDEKISQGCSKGCSERCVPDDCGVTCFSGNFALHPGVPFFLSPTKSLIPNQSQLSSALAKRKISLKQFDDPFTKLMVNEINPVKLDACGKCIPDEDGSTCLSGDTVLLDINPNPQSFFDFIFPTLYTNEINPVQILDGKCVPNDDGVTCISGSLAVDPNRTLYVNEIDPVVSQFINSEVPCGTEDTNPCAFTQFNGNVCLKNSRLLGNNNHIFGQLNCSRFSLDYCYDDDPECDPINLEATDTFPFGDYPNTFGYPFTECKPVLRLSFAQTDTTQQPFPQGAWVKLNVFGTAQINLFDGEVATPLYFDVFTQLYFHVGAGNAAPCSAFVGTLNGIGNSNTLSSQQCYAHTFFKFPTTGSMALNSLFGLSPTSLEALSAPAIIGTTATSSAIPNAVDILLMGVLPPNSGFNFERDYYSLNLNDTFAIHNITIYYEIISSNLDPANPPCIPDPAFDQAIYDQACQDLVNTFTTEGNLPLGAG